MNKILRIKMNFNSEKNTNTYGPKCISANRTTNIEKIDCLINDLINIKEYYKSKDKLLSGYLIDVCYDDIIAKSKRIQSLLKEKKYTEENIVGARFSDDDEGNEKHIITHYVTLNTLNDTINKLYYIKKIISTYFEENIDKNNFNNLFEKYNRSFFKNQEYKYDEVKDIIIDTSVVLHFSIPNAVSNSFFQSNTDTVLVTFYETEITISDIFQKYLKDYKPIYTLFGDNSISIDKDSFNLLYKEIPYLISMVAYDISTIKPIVSRKDKKDNLFILPPKQEPVIGVIDTLFNQSVYFNEWVEYCDKLDEYEKYSLSDDDIYLGSFHGTEVSSLIVDGPTLNPELDDGCGHFRVKHFGVCCNRISPSRLTKKIIEIVETNPQIHVWNLCLGANEEVSKNFISYEASVIDKLQAEKNIVFVISGTNDNYAMNEIIRIGCPADSINSIVVNSVRKDNTPCSYSRKGPVLSFYNKPDLSYYGGDINEKINVYSPEGIVKEMGTSLAAPWISRKLAYLIDVIGLQREVAKALLIDSAAGWNYKLKGYKDKDIIGYGVVPIRIEDILSSDKSEIRFLLYDTSKSYKTSNYAIPIPKDSSGKYPFIARATLCYFPSCKREQGVDYTTRELSIRLGRVDKNDYIDDINENIQDEENSYINEAESRKKYRKWDNTKFISNRYRNNRAKLAVKDRYWGFVITSKDRKTIADKEELNFGAVITLKEINGVNRIEEFKHSCLLRGYIVNELEISNQIDIYESSQEEIKFE